MNLVSGLKTRLRRLSSPARHPYRAWNKSTSTSERSADSRDAANRIFDAYYIPQGLAGTVRLRPGEPVFTMGSCFAREIEAALRRRGFDVTSMDLSRFRDDAVWSSENKANVGFFHRYNLPSMELELRRAVGDVAFDETVDLLVEMPTGQLHDLNYGPQLPRLSREGAVSRRVTARKLVATFQHSRAIILTLGLTEAWYYKPSGHYCNAVPADVLARYPEDFEFRNVTLQENVDSLEAIYQCLERYHSHGDFAVFLTVSPVPLQHTFSAQDVVVANSRSKSVLRAVADEFCERHSKAIYFPSYEMALYSNRELVWRPDRVHINPDCVARIVDTFIDRYVAG